MYNNLSKIKKELRKLSNLNKIPVYIRFFKTGKGEYGEGDRFIGVTVPNSRKVALKYKNVALTEVLSLLKSEIHEERMVALFILIDQFKKGDLKGRKRITDLYLKNTKYINNWDLVDLSADKILGAYLYDHYNDCATTLQGVKTLDKLSRSDCLWERRIAIISTFHFIKHNQYDLTIEIAKILLNDKHDLIHKAVGWMLREVGKREKNILLKFLDKYSTTMPRTCLRYAIEKLPKSLRQKYLSGYRLK